MMDFDGKAPIYIQIMAFIKTEIINEKLKIGDKLPSVREMAERFKVNPNTIQRAYQELEREEITYTQRGMGTFIKDDEDIMARLKQEMAKEMIDNFIKGMKNIGFSNEEVISIIKEKITGEN